MKPILLIGLCSWLIIGCSPTIPATELPGSYLPALIRVECTLGSHVERMVRQILKTGTVNDWEVSSDQSTLLVSARYQKLAPAKAAEIKDRLQELPWVLDVDIRYDGVPAKNIRPSVGEW